MSAAEPLTGLRAASVPAVQSGRLRRARFAERGLSTHGVAPAIAGASRRLLPGRCISARWSRPLASYCDARAADGEWLVRIEDVDVPRRAPGAERCDPARRSSDYGFEWDGPVWRQSRAHGALRDALGALARARPAFIRARARARELRARAARSPSASGSIPDVPRRHRRRAPQRGKRARAARAGRRSADRVHRSPARRSSSNDLAREVGDFVVRRSDGLYRVSARRRRRRRRAGRSPTSCAAPTCSRRRRARSSCSGCSACRRRATCTCRSRSTPPARSCRSRPAPRRCRRRRCRR